MFLLSLCYLFISFCFFGDDEYDAAMRWCLKSCEKKRRFLLLTLLCYYNVKVYCNDVRQMHRELRKRRILFSHFQARWREPILGGTRGIKSESQCDKERERKRARGR